MNNVSQELWYTYVTPLTVLAGNGNSGVQTVAINRGGDFLFERFVGISIQGGSYNVQIGDGGMQLLFTNQLVDSRLLLGTAQLWAPVIPAYLFPYNGAIQFQVVDTSGVANDIQLGFIGKVVPQGSYQPQAAQGHPQTAQAPQPSNPTRIAPGTNFYQNPEQAVSAFYRARRS